ncbi:MAG TPA: hypothetical protein PL033_02225 [Candidatus Brocadiia bacterium]|nr:hypothetical protein [Candidatus Brocadiia bacterium]
MKPDEAEGIVYHSEGTEWRKVVRLPGIYQPATLALDAERRLLIAYTRQMKPVSLLRARTPGPCAGFDELPHPPGMENGYYIGVASGVGCIYMAWLTAPDYSMYFSRLDLAAMAWAKPVLLSHGRVERKPKTAWTYPIIIPDGGRVHFVASNSPDGGEGNTYNEVRYLLLREYNGNPEVNEVVADTPMGHNSYATDAAVDASGRVHIVYMWNNRAYGEPLPPAAPEAGTYHSWRDPATGKWTRSRIGPAGITGFHVSGNVLTAVMSSGGSLSSAKWSESEGVWTAWEKMIETGRLPGPPGFMDVLTRWSGSAVGDSPFIVFDTLIPADGGKPSKRTLWAFMPE